MIIDISEACFDVDMVPPENLPKIEYCIFWVCVEASTIEYIEQQDFDLNCSPP